MSPITPLCMFATALLLSGCQGTTSSQDLGISNQDMTIRLESSAFADGGMIPKKYAKDGENVSPPLSWTGVPDKAASLAIICEDPDAPMGTFTHWLIYNLSAKETKLEENASPKSGRAGTARQGKNSFKTVGYGGPSPPSGTHRYVFTIYALDSNLPLDEGATRDQVLEAMKGHVQASGRLTGKYTKSK